ncbi:MAG: hypothetical protein ACKO6N_12140 [Myxococcota bacterium]
MELRTFCYLDVLQPQLAAFIATVARGFLPLENQASLFVEVAPGLSVTGITDAALKATSAIPGMEIVERAFGLLELHSDDQGQVRAAGEAILDRLGLEEKDRLKPRIVSSQVITGITGHHAMIINRFRHGNMISRNQTLYVLEVHPAGYAALAANEAEKAAPIEVLEVITFGAFGRLYLGGGEAEIAAAAQAAVAALEAVTGRENPGPPPLIM